MGLGGIVERRNSFAVAEELESRLRSRRSPSPAPRDPLWREFLVHSNPLAYLQSLSAELDSQASRVRNLIGSAHWLSDGHHKEYLLRGLLRRHLPAGVRASRGFVVDPFAPGSCSTEQDALIIDTYGQGPLFDQGGLVIASPSTVFGSISVRTAYQGRHGELRDNLEGLIGQEALVSNRHSLPWLGAYYFESEKNQSAKDFGEATQKALAELREYWEPRSEWNGLSCLIRFNAQSLAILSFSGGNYNGRVFCGIGAATGVFLANLLDHIARRRSWTSDLLGLADQAIGDAPDHYQFRG